MRLRSDEQLVELFRAGHEEAFRVIHDRYRARLFAYTRQMLPGSRQDAEDALQDVFIRAYSGLRANDRQLALRAWLYRVAHNRCVDQLRKNAPLLTDELEATSHDVSTDPLAAMEQREDLRKLVVDVQRLPNQQRSALLMREMSGMSYQELADSLELSVPAIKSLLVRARGGLAAAAEARDTDCARIRSEIVDSHERGARPNALTRRHLSDCAACREYRESVRGLSKSFAALIPAGPMVLALKLLGIGSVYSAAAYSSGAATAGGGAAGASAVAAGGAAAATGGAAVGGAAAVGTTAAGGAAVGGAAAGGAAVGGAAVGGAAVAGGVSAAHIAAILAAAAAAGGAVAVSQGSSHHHSSAPLHPAASLISHAVHSAIANGYSPAASVVPVTPVAGGTSAPASAATSAAALSTLKHQSTTALSTAPATTTPTSSSATTATASPATTATTASATTATTSDPTTSTASTPATTSGSSASTPVSNSAASTPVRTDSTSGSSTTDSSTAATTTDSTTPSDSDATSTTGSDTSTSSSSGT